MVENSIGCFVILLGGFSSEEAIYGAGYYRQNVASEDVAPATICLEGMMMLLLNFDY